MGPIDSKRIILNKVDIPDKTSTDFDNPKNIDLLVCQESVDEEVESNGTTVAEVRPYSKIVGFKWQGYITGPVSDAVNLRYVLYKMPDGESLFSAGLPDGSFHFSDDSQNGRELRSVILAKGMMGLNQSKGTTRLNLFVKRKTLRRLGSLRENDKIRLVLAHDSAPATNPTISGFGTIYVRHN